MHRAGIAIQLSGLRHTHPLTLAQRGNVIIRKRLDRARLLPGIWHIGRQHRPTNNANEENC